MQLKELIWKQFKIEDIFTVVTGANIPKNQLTIGDIPRVTARDTRNGVDGFYTSNNPSKFRKFRNIISVSFLGSVSYHPYEISLDMKIHGLKRKDGVEFDDNSALFICSLLRREFKKYSYGNQLSSTDLPKSAVLFPVDDEGLVDWNFMRKYIEEIRKFKILKYKQHAAKILLDLEYKIIPNLKEISWKEFYLIDLFSNIQRGKRLKKSDHVNGLIPYVSSTALNNGIDNFISNSSNVRKFSNCITIANSGSVGSSFYHPYEFIASDHVTYLKNKNMSKYVYLFITAVSKRMSEKYNFNREINDKRIAREKIMLPILDNGYPDYVYMEQYIKNIIVSKLHHLFEVDL